jgi:hypothetical protein
MSSDRQLPKPAYRVATMPQIMLVLEQSSGQHHALPYAHLAYIGFAQNKSLDLQFLSHHIHIKGRKLDQLLTPLQQHRIEWLAETPFFPAHLNAGVWVSNIQLNPIRD